MQKKKFSCVADGVSASIGIYVTSIVVPEGYGVYNSDENNMITDAPCFQQIAR